MFKLPILRVGDTPNTDDDGDGSQLNTSGTKLFRGLFGDDKTFQNVHKIAWEKFGDGLAVTDKAKVNAWLEEKVPSKVNEERVRRALDIGVDESKYVAALWECPKGHIWPALKNNISKTQKSPHGGCPACSGKLPTDENSLFALHEKTFASEFFCSLAGGKEQKLYHEEEWNKFRRSKLMEKQAVDTLTADHEKDKRIELCKKLAVITEDEVEAWLAQKIQLPSKGKSKRCTRALDHYRKKEAARRVTAKAGRTALWKCAKNHYWVSTIDNRTSSKYSECPSCKGIVATAVNNMYVRDYSAACELVCALAGGRNDMDHHNAEWDQFSKGRTLIDDVELEAWLTGTTTVYVAQKKKKGKEKKETQRALNETSTREGTEDKRVTQRALNELRGKMAATDLLGGSDAPALWKCTKRGHLGISSISNRIDREKSRSRCPFCSGNLPWEENNLYYHHPDVAQTLVCVLAGGKDAYKQHMADWNKLRGGMAVTDEAKVKAWLEEEITITKSQKDGGRNDESVRRRLRNESGVEASKRVLAVSNFGALWRCNANHYDLKQIEVRSKGYGCLECSLGAGWTVKALQGLLATFESSIADLPEASIYTIFEHSGAFECKSAQGKRRLKEALKKVIRDRKEHTNARSEADSDLAVKLLDIFSLDDGALENDAAGADDAGNASLTGAQSNGAYEPDARVDTMPAEDLRENDAAGADDAGNASSPGAQSNGAYEPAAEPMDTKTAADRTVTAACACIRAMKFKPNKHWRDTERGPKDDLEAVKFLVQSQVMMWWQIAIQDQRTGTKDLEVDRVKDIQNLITTLQEKLSDEDKVLKKMLETNVAVDAAERICSVPESVQHTIEGMFQRNAGTATTVGADQDDTFYECVLRACFVAEYLKVAQWELPKDYNPEVEVGGKSKTIIPNLMQRLTVIRLRESPHHGLGNWSDTGTGKTISAILASRDYRADLTVIVCPNDVVNNWVQNISSHVESPEMCLTLTSAWEHDNTKEHPRFLIISFHEIIKTCGDGNSDDGIRKQLEMALPKGSQLRLFLIVDELQKVKRRGNQEKTRGKIGEGDVEEDGGYGKEVNPAVRAKITKRRECVVKLLTHMRLKDQESRVLGLSATPVINDLSEAKSLIEMITNKSSDLECQPWHSVPVGIRMHRALMGCGLRIRKEEPPVPTIDNVSCADTFCTDMFHGGKISWGENLVKLERALTKVRDFRHIYSSYLHRGVWEGSFNKT